MAKKIPAFQGPLKSWVGARSWQLLHTWGEHRKLTHPFGVAVKLNERGEEAREAQVLMRNHATKIGAWYILRAEMIPKLRPVWVAGFRRTPIDYEVDNECILETEQLQQHVQA
jgi:hypothetical protein